MGAPGAEWKTIRLVRLGRAPIIGRLAEEDERKGERLEAAASKLSVWDERRWTVIRSPFQGFAP